MKRELFKCQVIHKGTDLYKLLENMSFEESIQLTQELNVAGYNWNYNNNDDCFVIY